MSILDRIVTPPSKDVDNRTIEDIYKHINAFYNGVTIPVLTSGGGMSGTSGSVSSSAGITVLPKTILSTNVPGTINIGSLLAGDVIDTVSLIVVTAFGSDNTMYLKDSSSTILGTEFFDLTIADKGVYPVPAKQYSTADTLSIVLTGTPSTGKAVIYAKVFRN